MGPPTERGRQAWQGPNKCWAANEKAAQPYRCACGFRIRLRRTLLGMSQERLGESLGLTFQQVQKYERGVNRVGASRLFDLSRVLDVPISFFFDDMPDSLAANFGGVPNRRAAAFGNAGSIRRRHTQPAGNAGTRPGVLSDHRSVSSQAGVRPDQVDGPL